MYAGEPATYRRTATDGKDVCVTIGACPVGRMRQE